MKERQTERWVALLRGINVGRAKRISMADLRALVEGLGHADVATLLNSGNVVFSGPRGAGAGAAQSIASGIEAAILERASVSAKVTVLSADELAAAIAACPLGAVATDPSRRLIAVLAAPAHRAALEPLLGQPWAPEAIALGARVAYLWCPGGIAESPLVKAVERLAKGGVTSRNWATMTKLLALARG